jgi:4-aminobutyrate aminotransferase-like enzyme
MDNKSFELFEQTLENKGISPETVCGVIAETYQGMEAAFFPEEYVQKLREWCWRHHALLAFDEVQAGFGRTGKLFAFEHYGVVPDLFCCGKGFSSGLPISAVLGRSAVMDLCGPGEMTSTHSGNPICVAAALASIEAILEEGMVGNACSVGNVLISGLERLKGKYPGVIGAAQGRGLLGALCIVRDASMEPDAERAYKIVESCMRTGLLMFAPVGKATVKIVPPLCATEESVMDGLSVLDEAIKESATAQL